MRKDPEPLGKGKFRPRRLLPPREIPPAAAAAAAAAADISGSDFWSRRDRRANLDPGQATSGFHQSA